MERSTTTSNSGFYERLYQGESLTEPLKLVQPDRPQTGKEKAAGVATVAITQ